MYELAAKYPGVTKLVKIGTTLKGREILALKVTQGARGQKDGKRPAVLFSAVQHAREWIAPEVEPPPDVPLHRGLGERRPGDQEAAAGTELWFVPVMNPDGYQYTFTNERLWRKNLRDNDGDGADDERRRRRPEPQLPGALQVRRGGLLEDPVEPDLPRPRPGVRARDAGDHGPVGARRLRVQRQLPLQRPLAAVPGGLADQLADGRRPDLLRAVGQPRQAGDRGLPSGPELGRPLRHQRRGQRLPAQAGRRAGLDPGAEPGLPVVRVRVPGRPGAGPGGVRAQPAVRRVGRELRGGPG